MVIKNESFRIENVIIKPKILSVVNKADQQISEQVTNQAFTLSSRTVKQIDIEEKLNNSRISSTKTEKNRYFLAFCLSSIS